MSYLMQNSPKMASACERLEFSDEEFNDARLNSIKLERGEVQGIKTQFANFLRSMLTGISGFRPCLDDIFLLRFLRGAKYRPESALKRLKTYYFSKRSHPEIFENFLPSHTFPVQAFNHIKALPYRAKNLSPVVVIRLGEVDFERVSFLEIIRLYLLVFETLLLNPVTQLTGLTLIVDCDGFSHADMSKITTCLPACYDVFHADCSLRLKYVHVVNVPMLLQLLYQNILPTFSQDQHHKVVFYQPDTDLDELHKQVSVDYLPEEYGGSLPSSSLVDLNPVVNAKENYFRDQLQYGVSNEELEFD